MTDSLSSFMTLAQAQTWLQARGVVASVVGDPGTALQRVHTDTRTLRAGDLFVALRGERFDAHDFLAQARDAGATAALAQRGLAEAGLPGLLVSDTLVALQQLSAAWRERRPDLPVIAVTGSNGKTTVTQMLASILRAWHGDGAHSTQGNLNNHIGVPLTLLALRDAHRSAVIELGMNHPGEIAELSVLARPTVALVNNAQREHQEFMKTVEAVAVENGTVLKHLPVDGVAVFPAADPYTPVWERLADGRRCMRFFLAEEGATAPEGVAEVRGRADWAGDHWRVAVQTPAGDTELRIAVAGRHNVRNALAATAAALGAGCPLDTVREGLDRFHPVKGRSQLGLLSWRGHSVTLIDDTYNANPDSVRAAIDVLAELPGPRWLVLGDMGEVGDQGPAFHAEVGAYAAERGVDTLWTAGTLAQHARQAFDAAGAGAGCHFTDAAALSAALEAGSVSPPPMQALLVKGSRFMRMEGVIATLQAIASSNKTGGHHAG